MRAPGIETDPFYLAGRNAAIEMCLASKIHEDRYPVDWIRHEMLRRLQLKFPEMLNGGGQWKRFDEGAKDGLNNMFINYREDELNIRDE